MIPKKNLHILKEEYNNVGRLADASGIVILFLHKMIHIKRESSP